jgi:hypothetical protein
MKQRLIIAVIGAALVLPAGAAAQRPRLMVLPSDNYMLTRQFYTEVPQTGGRPRRMWDYERALQEDRELNEAIASIAGIFQDRSYPLTDLAQTLRTLADQAARRSMQSQATVEDPVDQILRTARPDIALYLEFNRTRQMGQERITFTLRAMDAYSAKEVATTTGTGEPSGTVVPSVLIREAVLQRMPQFEARLMSHFADIGTNGREVRVRVELAENSSLEDGLETEFADPRNSNQRTPLVEIIKDLIASGAVRGAVEFGQSTGNFFEENVRIPLFGANNNPQDAGTWAQNAVIRPLRAMGVSVRALSRQPGDVLLMVQGTAARTAP